MRGGARSGGVPVPFGNGGIGNGDVGNGAIGNGIIGTCGEGICAPGPNAGVAAPRPVAMPAPG